MKLILAIVLAAAAAAGAEQIHAVGFFLSPDDPAFASLAVKPSFSPSLTVYFSGAAGRRYQVEVSFTDPERCKGVSVNLTPQGQGQPAGQWASVYLAIEPGCKPETVKVSELAVVATGDAFLR